MPTLTLLLPPQTGMTAWVSQSYWCMCHIPQVWEKGNMRTTALHTATPTPTAYADLTHGIPWFQICIPNDRSSILLNWSYNLLPEKGCHPFVHLGATLSPPVPLIKDSAFIQGPIKVPFPRKSSQSPSPRLGPEAVYSLSQHFLSPPSPYTSLLAAHELPVWFICG